MMASPPSPAAPAPPLPAAPAPPSSATPAHVGAGGLRLPLALLLLVYLGVRVYLVHTGGLGPSSLASPLEPLAPRTLQGQIIDWALGAGLRAAGFLPLGLLLVLLLPRTPLRRSAWLRAAAPWLTVPAAWALVVHENGGAWPGAPALILPSLGTVLGGWVGTHWARRGRGVLLLLCKLVVLGALGGVVAGLLYRGVLAPDALPIPLLQLSTTDRHRLWDHFQRLTPEDLAPGQSRTVDLPDRDLNLLLAWAANLAPERHTRADVAIAGPDLTLRASLRLPLRPRRRFLNLTLSARPYIDQAGLRGGLGIERVQLGALPVPHWVARAGVALALSALRHDRKWARLFGAITGLRCEGSDLRITYRHTTLPPGFLSDLFHGAGASPQVMESVGEQARHLIDATDYLMREGRVPTLRDVMSTAFVLARVRSQQGDPVLENMAALLTLGMFIGHPRVMTLVGPVPQVVEHGLREQRRLLGMVPIRGRQDWTKHFFVSASLTLLAARAVSNAAGQLKEELDMRRGGSGFSFGDLLADRAGTLFAVAATRDEAAARAVQARIAAGFKVEDFFPEAADLPEGISAAELRDKYGGVGGPGYRKMLDEIDRRLRTCPGLR